MSRHDQEPGYVLHTYPFRETSLIVETFTRQYGRLPLVARGARRPRSPQRGVLLAFAPLELGWFGKHELRTLAKAEWLGGQPQLAGVPLICGLYLNELLLRLLPRDDPHEQLWDRYAATLLTLARHPETDQLSSHLRSFEWALLRELGYAARLTHAADDIPISAENHYNYLHDRGLVQVGRGSADNVSVSGQTLLDMQAENYQRAATRQESKSLLRHMLGPYLGEEPLHTRNLLRDLAQL